MIAPLLEILEIPCYVQVAESIEDSTLPYILGLRRTRKMICKYCVGTFSEFLPEGVERGFTIICPFCYGDINYIYLKRQNELNFKRRVRKNLQQVHKQIKLIYNFYS